MQAVLNGGSEPVSWQRLMTGLSTDRRELRRFILTRPVLDFDALESGARARAEIRRMASELNIDPQHGVRVRLTGPVALNDEQFATLEQGAVESTVLSLVLVGLILLWGGALGASWSGRFSRRCCAGLVLDRRVCRARDRLAEPDLGRVRGAVHRARGRFRHSVQRPLPRRATPRAAVLPGRCAGAAERIGPSILLAGAATAIGFLAFVPTSYTGVRELGWIAGFGMLVAVVLNLVLLPALLALLRPRGEPEPVGFRWAAPIDRLLMRRRRWVMAGRRRAGGGLASRCCPWSGSISIR